MIMRDVVMPLHLQVSCVEYSMAVETLHHSPVQTTVRSTGTWSIYHIALSTQGQFAQRHGGTTAV